MELLEHDARNQKEVTGIFRLRCLEGDKAQLLDWLDRVGEVGDELDGC